MQAHINLSYWSVRSESDVFCIQMAWNSAPSEILERYRVAHNLSTPAAFTSPLNQALLTNPGIGRQSPTMARKKDKRRVSKDQLALAVRKNFNSAAISEIDVTVEMVYKIKHQGKQPNAVTIGLCESKDPGSADQIADKAFRMRSYPGVIKKS